MTGPAQLAVGQLVKVSPVGRRSFEAKIIALRESAIDVKDPRNGGLRTIAVDLVETVRPACDACDQEVPAGRRRSRDETGRLVCSECRP